MATHHRYTPWHKRLQVAITNTTRSGQGANNCQLPSIQQLITEAVSRLERWWAPWYITINDAFGVLRTQLLLGRNYFGIITGYNDSLI